VAAVAKSALAPTAKEVCYLFHDVLQEGAVSKLQRPVDFARPRSGIGSIILRPQTHEIVYIIEG
jgi:hypothetical protein